jgi:hypothetical protein
MKKKPENDSLLQDLLHSEDSQFREETLQKSLQGVRAKRNARARNKIVLGVAMVCLGAVVWTTSSPKPSTEVATPELPTSRQKEEPSAFIKTGAPASHEFLTTRNTGVDILTTADFKKRSGALLVEIVETRSEKIPQLTDDELLAVFKGHQAVLVATGPNTKELKFLNPKDRDKFFGNSDFKEE